MGISQYYLGLASEGPTDKRFLESVSRRLLAEIAFECRGNLDIEVFLVEKPKTGLNFIEYVCESAREAFNCYGASGLMMHVDADKTSYKSRMETHFEPAVKELALKNEEEYCKELIPIVPVRMIEAWMLADKNLLKDEIGTDLSDSHLGLDRKPEEVADPKDLINKAIAIAKADDHSIDVETGDLYEIIGAKVSLDSLRKLSSFIQFENDLRNFFKQQNLL